MGFNLGFNKASWVRLVVPEEKKESFASLEQNIGTRGVVDGGGRQGGDDVTDRDAEGRMKWNNFRLYFISHDFFFPVTPAEVSKQFRSF